MGTHCPICGHPFSPVDVVLSEHDVGYQCRHCWNRVRATGAGVPPYVQGALKKPRILDTRRATPAKPARRKK